MRIVLLALVVCSGCTGEYVHWEPDPEQALQRVRALPPDKAATIRLSSGRTVGDATNLAFAGPTLNWTDADGGFARTLPLARVDTIRVVLARRTKVGALIGGIAGAAPWLIGAAVECPGRTECHWLMVSGVTLGSAALGSAVGAALGWTVKRTLYFVRE